ncbi:hypothetical protein PR048_006847 [Dryococelus australis]|uniref:Uncharacterized protein n=1 Tax=Dryococelus australis TaxID=614101 RepID=A0ABQ9IDE6_9NEOP|nr:hypothetical protein PR048_006847 [Dryococelus australis]
MRLIEVIMEKRRNERAGETRDPRENPLTNGIVWHDSRMRKSGIAMVRGGQASRSVTLAPRHLVPVSTGFDSRRGKPPPPSRWIFVRVDPCRKVPLVGEFSRGSHLSVPLHYGAAPYLHRCTLIGSQDIAVKSRPKPLHSLYRNQQPTSKMTAILLHIGLSVLHVFRKIGRNRERTVLYQLYNQKLPELYKATMLKTQNATESASATVVFTTIPQPQKPLARNMSDAVRQSALGVHWTSLQSSVQLTCSVAARSHVHARHRREDCTIVGCLARRGDTALHAPVGVSVALLHRSLSHSHTLDDHLKFCFHEGNLDNGRTLSVNNEVLRADAGEMTREWSSAGTQGRGEREMAEKIRRQAASSGTITTCENLGSDPARPGLDPVRLGGRRAV